MKVYEAMAELVRRSGQNVVFGLVGSSNVAWVSYGIHNGYFRFVRTRHESATVSAAVAYTRVTGKTAVATTTLGPGFANSVNALLAAVRDNIPLVLITGQSPTNKSHGSQNINQKEIVAAVGAGFYNASKPEELEPLYRKATEAASWNGTPYVVSFDENMLAANIELSGDFAVPERAKATPDPASVAAAIDVLADAENPVILAGWGAVRAGCREDILTLAELVGARLTTSMNANHFFAGHPDNLGLSGTSSPPIIAEELYKSDVVLAVGASLNGHTTSGGGMFPAAKIIQCELDIERDFKASAPELGLIGDAGESVRALIDEWKGRGHESRTVKASTPTVQEVQGSVLKVDLGHDPSRGLDARRVYSRFNELLPADRVVVTDGGRAGHSLPTLLDARDAHSWLPSRGHGSIGLGLGAAIGAAAAAPDRRVVLFCGDGGFTMAAQELDAIRLNDLNLTIVVMNDAQYGSEVKYLKKFGLPLDAAQQTMPDTVLLARAYGGDGIVIETDEDLEAVTLPEQGLFVVEARIDPDMDARAI